MPGTMCGASDTMLNWWAWGRGEGGEGDINQLNVHIEI